MSDILLSNETTKLLNKINLEENIKISTISDVSSYLNREITDTNISNLSYLDASFRLALLNNLITHYEVKKTTDKKNLDFKAKATILFLAFLGILYSTCNGFAGGAAILTLFLGIQNWVFILVGAILAIIYITLFLGLDIPKIAERFNFKLFNSNNVLDLLVSQNKLLKVLLIEVKDKIDNHNEYIRNAYEKNVDPSLYKTNEAELIELLELLGALTKQQENLSIIKKEYIHKLQQPHVRALKLVFPIVTDMLFFSYGFFTGQAIATLISIAFFAGTISTSSLPVIIISIIAGLVAVCLYWANDRFNVENFASSWVGLDSDKIELLPNPEEIENKKLTQIEKQSHFNMRLFKNKPETDDDIIDYAEEKKEFTSLLTKLSTG
ncbi:MAG: hypothetical protein P1U74_02655 [Legionellaceae bacterium]|nr:hypothetical protein [Legionellaceae bacterium]